MQWYLKQSEGGYHFEATINVGKTKNVREERILLLLHLVDLQNFKKISAY